MCIELSRPFTSVHSKSALEREINMAEALMESDGTADAPKAMPKHGPINTAGTGATRRSPERNESSPSPATKRNGKNEPIRD